MKIFTKVYNSYSGNHEFANHRANAEALHGTGCLDLVDLQDYLHRENELQSQSAKLTEQLESAVRLIKVAINNINDEEDLLQIDMENLLKTYNESKSEKGLKDEA